MRLFADEEDYFREEEDEDPEPSVRGLEEPDSPRPPLPNGTALSHDTFKPLSALADYGNDDDDDNGDASSFLSEWVVHKCMPHKAALIWHECAESLRHASTHLPFFMRQSSDTMHGTISARAISTVHWNVHYGLKMSLS